MVDPQMAWGFPDAQHSTTKLKTSGAPSPKRIRRHRDIDAL